ncbi:Pollen Ole e 1 allergen/extensin, partial [Cynara cardunculus var. scolymus]
MWSWVCLKIALILCLSLNDVSEASQDQAEAALVGALVAVECGGDGMEVTGAKPRFQEEVRTDEKGEFRVELPFSVGKRVEGCFVKSVRSSEPDCAVAVSRGSSTIRLKVKTSGNRVFSAGSFAFKPLKRPKQCHTKPRNKNSDDEFSAAEPFPSPARFLIPPVTRGKQTTTGYDDSSDADALGLPFQSNPFQPPFQFQPPPDSMFTPYFQPPPASIFDAMPLQPPPDS